MAGLNPIDERMAILLSCYLDGALEPHELDEVVVALETDLDVIAEFRRLREARRAIRMLPLLAVPAHLMPVGHLGVQLSAFLDGELTTSELPIVTEHLDTCRDCRAELAELDRSRTAIRALPGLEPPSFLDASRPPRRRSHRGRWTAAMIATGAAAAAIAFAVGPMSEPTQPTSISIADLDARHAAVASVPSGVQVSQEVGGP